MSMHGKVTRDEILSGSFDDDDEDESDTEGEADTDEAESATDEGEVPDADHGQQRISPQTNRSRGGPPGERPE